MRGSVGEKAVEIMSQLYAARRSMKFLYGDEYPALMVEQQARIAQFAAVKNLGTLPAVMEMVKRLQAAPEDTGVVQALILAAYVEMIEPSEAAGD